MFKIYSFRISFMYIIQMKQCCFHGFLWLVNLKKIRIGTNGASNIGFDQNFKVKPPRQTSCMLHQVLKGEDGGCLFILKLFQMFSPSWSHSNSSSPHLPSPLFLRGRNQNKMHHFGQHGSQNHSRVFSEKIRNLHAQEFYCRYE